jgi:DNA polymerase III alpha subunit
MQIPLGIFSDASMSLGNDLPKTMVSAAKKQGYSRVALVDFDAMSAVVKFADSASKESLGAIVGATLSVSSPERDEAVWLLKNKILLARIESASGCLLSSYQAVSALKSRFVAFHTVITKPTPLKVKNAIDLAVSNGWLSDSNTLASANSKSITSRGEITVLKHLLREVLPPDNEKIIDNPHCWNKIGSVLKKADVELPMGTLTFISKDEVGYKNLLSLASIKAQRKHKMIQDGSTQPLAINLQDIAKYKEGLFVFDDFSDRSLLGALAYYDQLSAFLVRNEAALVCLDAVGIPYQLSDEMIARAESVGRMLIPYPSARYAEACDYEAYCVKVAVHNDQRVSDFTFEGPEEKTFIHPYKEVVEYYHSHPSIERNFWEKTIPNTPLSLGEVHLPSYDMPVKDVIEYAFSLEGEPQVFSDIESANSAFDAWLKLRLPESLSFFAFRQKKLNDYCMHKIVMDGLPSRLKQQYGDESDAHLEDYLTRIDREYKVIESMGFSGYFLIEYDFVSYARKIGVPVGPGRGSAAGSLVVYCMEITDVDPIEHGLQFERFLNPERVSMPDIDVDFGDGGDVDRSDVLRYIRETYQQKGSEFTSSSQIANINRYQLKSAISAVRKAYNLSMTYDRDLKKLISDGEQAIGLSKPKSISWDELMELDVVQQRIQRQPMLHKILRIARKLTGKMSAYGVHAGGVVISPTVISDYSALACDDKGNYFSQLDKDDIERAGLIKFDVLGLRTLSIISECVRQIEKNHGVTIDPRFINFNDPEVYNLICQQHLADVFQLEGSGMRDLVGNLQPQNVGELAVLSALFRPGALDSGMVEEYIEVKQGKRRAKYDHPALESVTEETFGCIVYQEQVMSIVRELAGYSLGQADLLRRAMGKKKIEEMAKQRSVYSQKAMIFWREHYLSIGEQQGFDFKLDVNLLDLENELRRLNIFDCLDEQGFVSDLDSMKMLMARLLKLEKGDANALAQRLSDYNYVVMLFKQHYKNAIENSVHANLDDVDLLRRREVSVRLYYVLSQYVRFNQIFNKVEKFAGYGFNKSHAIAYSIVTYESAYFKCHYPAEFYSAALSFKDLDALQGTVLEATQKMGVKVSGPHINKSLSLFSVEDGMTVRYGLGKLKNMGSSAPEVVNERVSYGVFKGVFDFLLRMKKHRSSPDSRGFASLAATGAFDEFIPKRIQKERKINGRQFMIWFRSAVVLSPAYKNQESYSFLHEMTDKMSDKEFCAYLVSVSSRAVLSKMVFVDEDTKGNSALIKNMSAKVTAKDQSSLMGSAKSLCADGEEYPLLTIILDRINTASSTPFELQFLQSCVLLSNVDAMSIWSAHLAKEAGKPVTETLNEERDAAGFYMTSTPIKVLRIAERVEREPPSSVIDGCPVEVGKIDGSYDEQNLTTYGIVRNVEVKTVKREDSPSYGEKMLFFDLEDGAEHIRCMIFGTKKTNMFNNKIIQDGHVMLVAGEASMNDFGLTLHPAAIKRYYPVEDERLHVVPR